MIKKILVIGIGGIIVAIVMIVVIAAYLAQRADYGWNPDVSHPMFINEHPCVVIDQAHNNASTAGWTNRYWPFARLLEDDGYDVQKGTQQFTDSALKDISVLVIVNASGAPKPQMFGLNIPINTDKSRDDPAFSENEIQVVQAWVDHGGSLLLIADHAPFGAASAGLAAAFGVVMHAGFTEVPGELSDPLLFSNDNHRLGIHPILSGSDSATAVHRLMTFTGQSLDGPADATVLLILPDTAEEWLLNEPDPGPRPAGKAQGLALEYGRGRVVILGEAAMLTAQVDKGEEFGMNTPDNDNQQFALNVMHWLSRKL